MQLVNTKYFCFNNYIYSNKICCEYDDSYRYGFNGQEKETEITGSESHYSAEYWMYDSRVGRRWNLDPKPNPSISQYACFAGNPIMFSDPLGDTTFIDRKGYVIRMDVDENGNLIDCHVYRPKLTIKNWRFVVEKIYLGELTGTIKADGWFKNLLKDNSKEADKLWMAEAYIFYSYIRAYGKWDYKSLNPEGDKMRKKLKYDKVDRYHILGIAFSLDDDTEFIFEGGKYRSEDLNNFHFGVVAKAYGYLPESVWLRGAGVIEQGKWDKYEEEMKKNPLEYPKENYNKDRKNWGDTFGDNPTDNKMINKGYIYYDKHKKELDGE